MNDLLTAVILVACLPLAAAAATLAYLEQSLRGLRIPRVSDF
jgi:hypothetical protein